MGRWMAAAGLAMALAAGGARAGEPGADGVYVVAAIQKLHATTPGYGFDALRGLIEALKPDVIAVETRPDELAARADTPGRPEYPTVVWPWLKAHPQVQAVALEPGGAQFQTMVTAASGQIEAFAARDPQASAYWKRLGGEMGALLQLHWRSPADAQDQLTADLAHASALVDQQLIGEDFGRGQKAWDGHMVEAAARAIRAHPGQRVLVLVSWRNRAVVEAGLRASAGSRLQDPAPPAGG